MEKIKVPQTTLVYPLSGSIVIRNIRNREVLLFCKSGKHVQNLNTPLNTSQLKGSQILVLNNHFGPSYFHLSDFPQIRFELENGYFRDARNNVSRQHGKLFQFRKKRQNPDDAPYHIC